MLALVFTYIYILITPTPLHKPKTRQCSLRLVESIQTLFIQSVKCSSFCCITLFMPPHGVMKVSAVPSWCSQRLKTLQRRSETAALSDFPEQLGIEVLHLPRLQVAEPEAQAAVREAVLQGLQLAFRKQEQRGQACRLGQPHHRGRAVGVIQHHHLGRVVPEHHGDIHARGSVQLEASWHRVAPLKREVT